MIERYKASQFLKENKNYDEEDLTQIFKDAKKDNQTVYLCKKCGYDLTTFDNGLCINCMDDIEDRENYDEIFNIYNDMPNVELINDLEADYSR